MRHPALALLEFESVAAGIRATDTMIKRAPIAILKAGTVHPGRYLALIGGSIASVEEAWKAGSRDGEEFLLDQVFLPDVHEEVFGSVFGERRELKGEALGILESRGAASILRGADAGIKGADVRIAELRMADDLGGRAFVLFDGRLTDVQAALEIGGARVKEERVVHRICLPRIDSDLRRLLDSTTRFAVCEVMRPEGAENE
jgi:microcompartment protein CcmL/EutN